MKTMNQAIISGMLSLFLATSVYAQEIWPYQPPENGDAPVLFEQLRQKGDVTAIVHANHLFDYCVNQLAGSPVIDKKLQHCEALLQQSAAMRALWDRLGKLAEQGNMQALIAYTEPAPALMGKGVEAMRNAEWVSGWKKQALSLLQKAANQGQPMAALALAKHYRMGVVTKADPVEAAAWALVFKQLTHAPDSPRFQSFMSSLSPEQREEASRKAHEYMASPDVS